MFPEQSCCTPSQESDIQGYYEDLFNVGDLCQAYTSKSKKILKYLFCYGCSPDQPKSTNNNVSTIQVCDSFVSDLDPKHFDNCGFFIPDSRGDLCTDTHVILPGNAYSASTAQERVTLFLNDPNVGTPPFFEEYTVEICKKGDPGCNCFDNVNTAAARNHGYYIISLVLIVSTWILAIS